MALRAVGVVPTVTSRLYKFSEFKASHTRDIKNVASNLLRGSAGPTRRASPTALNDAAGVGAAVVSKSVRQKLRPVEGGAGLAEVASSSFPGVWSRFGADDAEWGALAARVWEGSFRGR